MAYSVMPASRPRPGTVTAGSALVLVAAVLLAVLALVEFSAIDSAGDELDKLYTSSDMQGFGRTFAAVFFGGAGGLDVLFALTLGILGVFDLKGKRAARIMTWIFGSLALVCCGCGSAVYSGLGFESLPVSQGSPGGPDQPTNEQVADALLRALPSWFTGAILGIVLAMILSLLTGLVLLAVPPSNAYFRKLPDGWLPPTDWPSGYPGGYTPIDPWAGGYPSGGYPPGDYAPGGYAPGGYPGGTQPGDPGAQPGAQPPPRELLPPSTGFPPPGPFPPPGEYPQPGESPRPPQPPGA